MTFEEFERDALKTAFYPSRGDNIPYPLFGLIGEAGELANKYKKILRDDGGIMDVYKRNQLIDELSDVLWYCAALASELHVGLGVVAQLNLDKLRRRGEAGTLSGSGDGR